MKVGVPRHHTSRPSAASEQARPDPALEAGPLGVAPGAPTSSPEPVARLDAAQQASLRRRGPGAIDPAASPRAIRGQALGPAERPEVRFSKHSGPPVSFPLTADQAEALRGSNAVSPFLADDPRVKLHPDFLPPPTHPGDPGYWEELEAVVDAQLARRAGGSPAAHFDVPKIFADFDMEAAAQAVRADFPSHFPTELVKQLLEGGAKVDPSIIPPKTQAEFVDGPVLLARIIGWAVSEVSPSAFACKWHEGRARPESVVWGIHSGEIDAPPRLRRKIEKLGLKSAEDFTAYEEGCPRHPSWPAMHSAASAASLYLAVVMDLSPEQIAEARRLDFAVATSRTLAGVHFDTDNRAGLALGQEVLARALPDYLARFGADPDAVRAKIDSLRYDWFEHPAKASPPRRSACEPT